MIKFVAIIIGDNDFGDTFKAILSTVQLTLEKNPSITQEQMTQIIDMGIGFYYVAFQHTNHNTVNNQTDIDNVVKYLRDQMRILYNDEAVEASCSADHDGGAWYLDVIYNQISSF